AKDTTAANAALNARSAGRQPAGCAPARAPPSAEPATTSHIVKRSTFEMRRRGLDVRCRARASLGVEKGRVEATLESAPPSARKQTYWRDWRRCSARRSAA